MYVRPYFLDTIFVTHAHTSHSNLSIQKYRTLSRYNFELGHLPQYWGVSVNGGKAAPCGAAAWHPGPAAHALRALVKKSGFEFIVCARLCVCACAAGVKVYDVFAVAPIFGKFLAYLCCRVEDNKKHSCSLLRFSRTPIYPPWTMLCEWPLHTYRLSRVACLKQGLKLLFRRRVRSDRR